MLETSEKILVLLVSQKKEWKLASENYSALDNVQVKEFLFDGFKIKVQFNPERIVSSGAKLDKKSIETRPCFLCEKNRPKEQKKLVLGKYSVLVNPFPIFPEHFTIVSEIHTPQLIYGRFSDMLDLTRKITGFTVFYNGPKCGASAPDHFHFQAGTSGFMPVDNELNLFKEKYGQKIENDEVTIFAIKDGLRNYFVLESTEKDVLNTNFNQFYKLLDEMSEADEPMMNILTSFNDGKWTLVIFPRKKQRPSQFFEEGEKNILVSPASVEMGGLLITPLEKDFRKITQDDISDIYSQVLFNERVFDKLTEKIKKL